jgi:hypothetical protein
MKKGLKYYNSRNETAIAKGDLVLNGYIDTKNKKQE